MAMIKVRAWQLFLIKSIAVPVLKKVADVVRQKAEDDPDENWLDVLSGAFDAVISWLESDDAFETT